MVHKKFAKSVQSHPSLRYYVEELFSCLLQTFQKTRQDSPFQSIDESMTKFKGRSSLKQYMPMKPTKRGIKIWMRCDSQTGHVYDMDIYAGKEEEATQGTLGERVITKLTASIKEKDVTIGFDRFFTSVNLINNLDHAAVGTVMKNRKNMPKDIAKTLKKGEMEFQGNQYGTLCARWMDSKEVTVLTNCHQASKDKVMKKKKDGTRESIDCPDVILFYRKIMGGVDLADQMAGLYDLDRKSLKWWKKVIFRCLLFSSVNAWVIYKELRRNPRLSFLDFIVQLAEELIAHGKTKLPVKRASRGRPSLLRKCDNIGEHLPFEGNSRKRCKRCYSHEHKEKKNKMMCKSCNIALCINCFAPFHTN